jgi:methylenetetrahydrofolate reductase (NADPH)
MRFAEYFDPRRRSGPVISFEVFPPKTDAAMDNLRRVLPELIDLKPTFMTVTYGALGSTRERTLEIATMIRRDFGWESACHLTCVGSSRADIDRILHDIRRAGIENIVALRGDPPKGETSFVPPPDGYSHANELVAHIRHWEQQIRASDGPTTHHSPLTTDHSPLTGFGIAVAGYPEKHVEAPDAATDLANLKRKGDAGADVVITQLFYENADYFRFVDSARAAGVTQPIVPGLLPILSVKQIRRITSMCGSKIPPTLLAKLESAGDDDSAAEAVGIRQCVAQATELLQRGVPGIHFYVLNKSSHMRRIMEQLRAVWP